LTAAQVLIIAQRETQIRHLEEALARQKEIASVQADEIDRLKLLLRSV
jgi:hypothetical protein